MTNIDKYCNSVESEKAPIRRALLTNDDERFIRELILQWKLGQVNKQYFENKFGVSISDRYGSILNVWEARGDITFDGENYVLSRSALLQIDSLLHGFFLAEHREATRFV
jgi:oxygen-independent coproporphyrinogen-3 oxidase